MNATNGIGERLKYYRKASGYSQEELSQKTQVTVRTIQRIEKEEVNPHLNTIKQLSIALEIDVNDLLPQQNPKEETIKKKWLLLIHATPLIGLVLPLCNVLFPLFLWIHKREDNPIYDRHGAKVLNFQITALLLYVGAFVALLTVEKWGFIVFFVTGPALLLIILLNIFYVLNKEKCYYPLSIPFFKVKGQHAANLLVIGIIGFALSSCSLDSDCKIERLDGTAISSDSLSKTIDKILLEAKVPGAAVTVFNDSQPVYEKTFGYKKYPEKSPLTDSTNLYGASLSKAVFAVLVLKLVEDGVIDLDTPLESYLPKKIYEYEPQTRWHDDFSNLKDDSLYHKITARMCLAHTAGFPNWRWIEEDNKLKVKNRPGEMYRYSGEGFVYLQVVLEKLTGKGLQKLADEIIFQPLKMENSAYEWKDRFEEDFAVGHGGEMEALKKDKDNEPRGGSTLETTAADYVIFLTAVLNQQIISSDSYDEMFAPQIGISSSQQFGPGSRIATDKYDSINLSYGLGWGYFETPRGKAVFKEGNGNGFQHYSLIFPETGMGIMILTNSVFGTSTYQRISEAAIMNVYTPWEWQGYEPYDAE